jgi:CRP/FNR family transcriptional regulator
VKPYHLLAESQFFGQLSDAGRRALAGICEWRDARKREVLFREGEPGRAVYLLRRGHVQLHKTAPDGTDVVIKTVQPYELFGEVILFEQDRYPVTAVAVTDAELLALPRDDVHRLLDDPEFRRDFIAMLMRKQRYLAERIVWLAAHDAEDRLRRFLREQFGSGPAVQVTMSKKDIAAAIGTTPETLSRLIQDLHRRRVFRWKGKTLAWARAEKPE